MKVLFCIDGSPLSQRALEVGGDLFKSTKPQVTVLHVVPEVDERLRHYEKLHEEELKKIEKLFRDPGPGVGVVNQARRALGQLGLDANRKVRKGDPAEEILAEIKAGGYDLVILGSHSRLSLSDLFFGSVVQQVVEASPATVLVVKGPPAKKKL